VTLPTVALGTAVAAAVVLPSPSATLRAVLATAPRPMAMPDVAAATTDDSPPMAMASDAPACAPLVALLPMATAPAPEAVVELATLSGVVPFPPEPPIATALIAEALLPKPIAILEMPVALDSRPKAVLHLFALLRRPNAAAPSPPAVAKAPNTVTPTNPPPTALQPSTTEYVPEPSCAGEPMPAGPLVVVPGLIRPTTPLEKVAHVSFVLTTLASDAVGHPCINPNAAATAANTGMDLVVPLLRLPRAEVISDVATHAPSASFQMLL